jgi:hypothetical protein
MQVYARKFGRTEEEIHQYFVREQETLAGLFSDSAMPKLLTENDGAIDRIADKAYRFWIEEVGETSPGENLLPQGPQTRKAEA